MWNANLPKVVDELNQRAEAFAIGELQKIRVKLKGMRQASSHKLFSDTTTTDQYAFHHGGRTELQFNIGLEALADGEYLRHGVAFSLETSRSLPNIEVLIPKIKLFNEFLQSNEENFTGFEMWHFTNGVRSPNRSPRPIDASLIETGVFIFLGALQHSESVDYDLILRDFDRLLSLYKFVESGGAISPYVDSPTTFAFRYGNRQKMRSTSVNRTMAELSVSLRHNELQDQLHRQLCVEFGVDNVGTELPNGIGGRIDAVACTPTGNVYFEIKVGHNLQACIREAVGQLVEYSYWPGTQRATRLVIVGEPAIDGPCAAYLKLLRDELSIPIDYRQIVCEVHTPDKLETPDSFSK